MKSYPMRFAVGLQPGKRNMVVEVVDVDANGEVALEVAASLKNEGMGLSLVLRKEVFVVGRQEFLPRRPWQTMSWAGSPVLHGIPDKGGSTVYLGEALKEVSFMRDMKVMIYLCPMFSKLLGMQVPGDTEQNILTERHCPNRRAGSCPLIIIPSTITRRGCCDEQLCVHQGPAAQPSRAKKNIRDGSVSTIRAPLGLALAAICLLG